MKRDARLRGLSSEHHHALALARKLGQLVSSWSHEDARELGCRFDNELEPHFRVEDETLLPALRAAGALGLAGRLEAEHGSLRRMVSAARAGDHAAVQEFATLLADHVRFEERELFPACEALLPDEVLDAVAARAPRAP